MRGTIFPIALFVIAAGAGACGEPPVDDSRADRRVFPPAGIIQGTVSYQGPRPCSKNGHILGGALILVFSKDNPPPPNGLATTAINFGVIAGDILFANEPRNGGSDVHCPKDKGVNDTILASAPFNIYGMAAGTYVVQAFYDYTGDFFPLLKIRNLPEYGDTIGGYFDTVDAAKHAGDANYFPVYLPINVGVPDVNGVLQIPQSTGFVTDNVAVNIAAPAPFTRPYFYPSNNQTPDNQGATDPDGNSLAYLGGFQPDKLQQGPDYTDFTDSAEKPGSKPHPKSTVTDPHYMPVITMTQDHQVYAQPRTKTQATIDAFQSAFKQVRINWGVPQSELKVATDITSLTDPFHFQVLPPPKGGLFVWGNYDPNPPGNIITIPEGTVPWLWPQVIFAKLKDGVSAGGANASGLTPQGDTDPVTGAPIIILPGITLNGDSLFNTAFTTPPRQPTAGSGVDHFTVLIRPSVICIDASDITARGTLVTPFIAGPSSDPNEAGNDHKLFPDDLMSRHGVKEFASKFAQGCLPKGIYGINLVYPDSQAWTVPNEAGGCDGSEGTTQFDSTTPTDPTKNTCTVKPRPVLYSQGTRAVLEIVDAADPNNCKVHQLPKACCPKNMVVNAAGTDCVLPGQ